MHPEDVRMEREAKTLAKKAIGPFWRRRWRAFVALVQTYADAEAHDKLDALREEFWIETDPTTGPPPTAPAATDKETP